MVNSNALFKQFVFGTSTGFCLVMFLQPNFAISRDSEQVINQTNLELPLPDSLIIGVTLLIVSLHLILALLLTGLNFLKMGQGQPSSETLKIAMMVSAVGVAIALVSFKLSSPLLNSIALVATIINSATLLGNFLATFAVNE